MAGLLLVVGAMILVFYSEKFRHWFMRQVLRLAHWVNGRLLHRPSNERRLVEIRANLEGTVKFLHKGWFQLILVFFWVSMDWAFTALTLFFCFKAVGISLSLGLLLVGFTVMFLTSNINPVPSGLGVSEAALAGTFSYLGVGFESSLVAALLFRFTFFLIPLAVSTALYLDIMRSFLKSQASE
jgi:hypothetical protein